MYLCLELCLKLFLFVSQKDKDTVRLQLKAANKNFEHMINYSEEVR